MKIYVLLILPALFTAFSCFYNIKKVNTTLCDTTIYEEPTFSIKNFNREQTQTITLYLLDGSFRFRTKGSAKTYQIANDSINNLSVHTFGMSGFEKTDTLVFRTNDDLFFFFTDYHYIVNGDKCVLSDTVTVNGKKNIGSIIFPHMGIPRDSLDLDLSLRFYWNDMR